MKRFVIGTGRCGSTLLSDMLAKHPKMLVLSEFFGGLDYLNRFKPGIVGGAEFADIITQFNEFLHMTASRDFTIGEVRYDPAQKSRKGGQFNPQVPLPAPLGISLANLSSEPGKLLEEMRQWAIGHSPRPINEHYLGLFKWLADKLGKVGWIERSGASTDYFADLYNAFPDARYVHIHRDGLETALSMVEHAYFRIVVPYFDNPPTFEELKRAVAMNDAWDDDSVVRRASQCKESLERFGYHWSYSLAKAYEIMPRLDPSQLLMVRFEDMVAKPHEILAQISSFFDLPDGGNWIADAAAMIKSTVSLRAPKLSSQEYERLSQACEIGQVLLGRSDERGNRMRETVRNMRTLWVDAFRRAGYLP